MSAELSATWDVGKRAFYHKLGRFVQFFQVSLPTTSQGFPVKLLNPETMASGLLDCQSVEDFPDDIVEQAVMTIEIDEGLPVVGGVPIWERLEGEPIDIYKVFREYREGYYLTGTRSVYRTAQSCDIEPKALADVSKAFHWQVRCKAYDNYKTQEHQRKLAFDRKKLETKHLETADVLLETAMGWLEEHPEQLNTKAALTMLEIGIKAGRLAVGLDPTKPSGTEAIPQTNITINQGATNEPVGGSPAGQSGASEATYIESILSILDRSGALKKQEVVDADYEVIED